MYNGRQLNVMYAAVYCVLFKACLEIKAPTCQAKIGHVRCPGKSMGYIMTAHSSNAIP